MRKQILAGVMALALATGMTTSAMAFDHGGGSFHGGGFHGGGFRGGAIHSGVGGFHTNRFAGIRSFGGGWHPGGWRGRRFVGGGWGYGGWGYPYDAYAADIGLLGLGLGLAEVATGYCDPYYGYGYCGPAYYGTPIAWSW